MNTNTTRGWSLERRFFFYAGLRSFDECWPWYRPEETGYGHVWFQGKSLRAHRVSYEIFRGPIPNGLTLDHLCRNRACVNPSHVEPVSAKENTLRGVCPPAVNARKTHCHRGHPFVPPHLKRYPDGRRECSTCKKVTDEAKRRRYALQG